MNQQHSFEIPQNPVEHCAQHKQEEIDKQKEMIESMRAKNRIAMNHEVIRPQNQTIPNQKPRLTRMEIDALAHERSLMRSIPENDL